MRIGSNPITNLLHCDEGLPWQVCPHLGWSQPAPSHRNIHAMLPRQIYPQLNLPPFFEKGRSASTIPDVYPCLNTPSLRPYEVRGTPPFTSAATSTTVSAKSLQPVREGYSSWTNCSCHGRQPLSHGFYSHCWNHDECESYKRRGKKSPGCAGTGILVLSSMTESRVLGTIGPLMKKVRVEMGFWDIYFVFMRSTACPCFSQRLAESRYQSVRPLPV